MKVPNQKFTKGPKSVLFIGLSFLLKWANLTLLGFHIIVLLLTMLSTTME